MEYNNPSMLVKNLNFGDNAKNRIMGGVEKLAKAVKSTLGASGRCVIYEDARGNPVITKDGVTVADSVTLYDEVENIGSTLLKEAAQKTVREAGDGTTTAIVLAESLLKEVNTELEESSDTSIRDIKNGIESGYKKVVEYLSKHSIPVSGKMLQNVSAISCNNDNELGDIISEAYEKAGKDGVVLMDESDTEETFVEMVDGVQFDSGLESPHFITDKEKERCVLENPYVLIVSSKIPNVRKIQSILEHVIKNRRSLLIVAEVDQQVKSALLMNKVKGNISVNILALPGFGQGRADSIEDLALLTGAKVMNEELGDDLDLIQPDCLGEVVRSVTDNRTTVLTTGYGNSKEIESRKKDVRNKIKNEKQQFLKKKLQDRLAMLSGAVGIIRVGASSKIELKEKKDRVDDAIYATRAALQEGIIPGGGIALLNAANNIKTSDVGEQILLNAIKAPFNTILENAGINNCECDDLNGDGINVITGKKVDMIKEGIIDPVLVTKSALKNAVSVTKTIISADCVISNVRIRENESN